MCTKIREYDKILLKYGKFRIWYNGHVDFMNGRLWNLPEFKESAERTNQNGSTMWHYRATKRTKPDQRGRTDNHRKAGFLPLVWIPWRRPLVRSGNRTDRGARNRIARQWFFPCGGHLQSAFSRRSNAMHTEKYYWGLLQLNFRGGCKPMFAAPAKF